MNSYDDIIDHPHYQSKTRKHMSMLNRAAQFAPFAALSGYEELLHSESVNHAALTDHSVSSYGDDADQQCQEGQAHDQRH